MAEFGRLVEIVFALGLLEFVAGGLELFAHLLHAGDGGLLLVPLVAHGIGAAADVGELLGEGGEAELRGVVLLLLEGGLLDLELHLAAGELVEFLREGIHLGADGGAGLVDEVDGLVGQEALGDVAVGEDGGVDEGVVLDADAVVDLEAFAQAAEDGDGVLDGGLVDLHGLETAGEGGVLFDVLAVLVERGGADAAQLAAGEHGLEHVAGVHGALGLAGADDGVEFVDEEDDAPLALLDLVEDGLEALLELAAVLRAGDERAHVEGEHGLVLEALGHIAAEDALGEALDDGGLAHAGVADEDGVVLGLAGKDADDAADLGVAADDGVELALARLGDEVGAELLERAEGGLGRLGGDALVAADLLQRGEELRLGELEGLEEALRFGREGFGAEGAQEEMLCGEVVVAELFRGFLGGGEGVVDRLADVHLARGGGAAHGGQAVELALKGELHGARLDLHLVEHGRHDAVLLDDEGVEEVPEVDLLLVAAARLGLGGLDGLGGFLGEAAKIEGHGGGGNSEGRRIWNSGNQEAEGGGQTAEGDD